MRAASCDTSAYDGFSDGLHAKVVSFCVKNKQTVIIYSIKISI